MFSMRGIMKDTKDITLCSQILDIYILNEIYISNMIWKLEETNCQQNDTQNYARVNIKS